MIPAAVDLMGPDDPGAARVQAAVGHCHAWLEEHAGQCGRILRNLYEEQARMGITFADGPIPTFLRPCFLSPRQDAHIQAAAELLLACAERVIRALPARPDLRALLGLSPDEERLACLPSGLDRHVIVGRPDALVVGSTVRFIELNADSPAGVAWTDQREEVFLDLPFIAGAPFAARLRRSFCRSLLAEAIREAAWSFNRTESPRVAIVDWRDVKTRYEFEAVAEFFEGVGLRTVVTDPRELEYRGGRLIAGGAPVDVVYRRVIIKELLGKRDEPGVRDLLAAYEARDVCVVNPFGAKAAGSKAFFAVLSDPRFDDLFTDRQNEMKRACVPLTRVMLEEKTQWNGARVDLFEQVRRLRSELVLKPTTGYGGQDVAIGREIEPGRWDELLQDAARRPGEWIVQTYAEIPEEDLPVLDPDLRFITHKLNLNPFLFGGRYAGTLGRASIGSVINVSQGGGIVPIFRLLA